MSIGMFFRHFSIRLRALVTSPTALFMLLVAGWSSLLLWPWFFHPSLPYAPAGVDLLVHLVFIFVWPMMVAFGTIGATVVGGVKTAIGIHALPALPIGRRSRALADALASLLVALVLRMVSAEISLAWFGLREPVTGEPIAWSEFAAETAIGALLMLPGVVAWVSSQRLTRALLITPLVVAAVTFAALHLGLLTVPVVGPLLCLGLAAVVLLLPDYEIRLPARFTLPRLPGRPLHRPGLDPETRFRLDQWQGPLRRWGPVVTLFVCVSVIALLFDYWGDPSEDKKDLLYGLVFGLSFSFVGMTILFPVGIHLFQTDRFGGNGSIMSGGYRAAWSVLPVRPVAVARAVYLHCLAVGTLWILYIVAFMLVANLLGLQGIGMLRFFLPLGLAVPAVAGVMTCTAVGDRVRGLVSFVAVLCILPAHIGNEMAFHWAGVTRGSSLPLTVDVALLALLGAIGGLPPLVHLRRPWREDHA